MSLPSWNILAASSLSQEGMVAAVVATVDVKGANDELLLAVSGPITLQQFNASTLFRIAIHQNDGPRNTAVLCLPPDEEWEVSIPRKVKGKRSRMRALEITVTLKDDSVEGYKRIIVTIPFDGEDGSAMLFANALVFASTIVKEETSRAWRNQYNQLVNNN